MTDLRTDAPTARPDTSPGGTAARRALRTAARRVLRFAVSLAVLLVASFAMIHLIPGDPVRASLGPSAPAELVATRTAALRSGEVHVAKDVAVEEIAAINSSGRAMAKVTPSNRIPYYVMDTRKPPLDNVKLRQAINYGANIDGIIRSVLYGNGTRVATVVVKKCDGIGPVPRPDSPLADDAAAAYSGAAAAWDNVAPSRALDATWSLIRATNAFLEANEPWKSDPGAAVDAVMGDALEALRIVAVLLHPWMPASAAKLLAALGTDDVSYAAASLGAGHVTRVDRLEPLFPKHAEPGGGAAASSGEAA